MGNIFKVENMNKLDTLARRKLIPPKKVLDLMNINIGDTVLDIGAGIGYFSIPSLEYVGTAGKVIAADISVEMLKELRLRTSKNNSNLKFLLCNSDEIDLKNKSVDKILMAFVFHEITEKKSYLKELWRIMKKDGELTIVEWDKVDSPMGPPLHERLDYQDISLSVDKTKFNIIKYEMINPLQYIFILKKI